METYTDFFNKYKSKYLYYKAKDMKRFGTSVDYSLAEFIIRLHNTRCFYCKNRVFLGLDRIDNSIGHIAANTHPCCNICNTIRWNRFSVKETKEIVLVASKYYRVIEYEPFDTEVLLKMVNELEMRKLKAKQNKIKKDADVDLQLKVVL